MTDERQPYNVALLDLDGTVADWHGALEQDLDELLGEHKDSLPQEILEKIRWTIRRRSGWYANLKPIPLGLKIEKTLREIGFTIMVATKASPETTNAWSEKAAWCLQHLPHAQVTITQDKTKVYGKILVDDYPKFAGPWLSNRPRGIVIMPDQPWNQGYEHPRVYRVRTTADVDNLIPMLRDIYER